MLSNGTHKTSLLKEDNYYILRLIVVILWFLVKARLIIALGTNMHCRQLVHRERLAIFDISFLNGACLSVCVNKSAAFADSLT